MNIVMKRKCEQIRHRDMRGRNEDHVYLVFKTPKLSENTRITNNQLT